MPTMAQTSKAGINRFKCASAYISRLKFINSLIFAVLKASAYRNADRLHYILVRLQDVYNVRLCPAVGVAKQHYLQSPHANFFSAKMHRIQFQSPDPAWVTITALPRRTGWWGGADYPFPRTSLQLNLIKGRSLERMIYLFYITFSHRSTDMIVQRVGIFRWNNLLCILKISAR